MTLDDFKQTAAFDACSDKMKLWLVTAIENGFDYTAATRAAFAAKDPAKFSHAVRNWPAVHAALNVYRGLSAFDIWFEATQRAFRNKRTTIAQIQALKLQADAMGWNADGFDQRLHGREPKASTGPDTSKPQSDPAPSPDPESHESRRFKVGDIVTQDGERYRITAVDENGKPTAVNSLGPIE